MVKTTIPATQNQVVNGEAAREFNRADINPKEFLVAVMRDQSLPMSVRIDAASKVAVYEHPRLAQVNQETNAGITIRIEGGLPSLPGTNIIMPGGDPIVPPENSAPSDGIG